MTRRIDKSEVQGIRNRIKAKQGNVCAICGRAFTKADYPVLDHDHDTGEVRGLLCHRCNAVLGLATDNIEIFRTAIEYLDR